MKKNNKGFLLAEVFIVSSFVLGVLVYMFIQINSIMKNYNRSFSYDTIQGLYTANEIMNYLKMRDSNLESNSCNNYQIINLNDEFGENIKKKANIKTIIIGNTIYMKENIANDTSVTPKTKDYIKYINEKNNCILLLEFNDETYASLNTEWREYEK